MITRTSGMHDMMDTLNDYEGCQSGFPVVWCATNGLGHSKRVPMSTVGLWRFWSQF